MATLLYTPRKSGYRSPQRITGIDWSNPLTRQLEFAIVASSGFHDLAKGRTVTPTSWGISVDRGGLVFSRAASTGYVTISPAISATPDHTIMSSQDDIINAASTTSTLAMLDGSSIYHAIRTSGGRDVGVFETAFSGSTFTGAGTYWTGAWRNAGTAGEVDTFATDGTQRNTTHSRALAQNIDMVLGDAGLSRAWVNTRWLYIWSRALTDAEIIEVNKRPYQIVRQAPRTYFIPAAAGGGFQPAWAARSTITISGGMPR